LNWCSPAARRCLRLLCRLMTPPIKPF
jgi:hypothetical protein